VIGKLVFQVVFVVTERILLESMQNDFWKSVLSGLSLGPFLEEYVGAKTKAFRVELAVPAWFLQVPTALDWIEL
jgi:hypothetical protein